MANNKRRYRLEIEVESPENINPNDWHLTGEMFDDFAENVEVISTSATELPPTLDTV